MALVQVIKCDADHENQLVEKFPDEAIAIGSQLIVNQSQEAVFVKGGKALDLFGPGTHTLSTANIPILSKLINLPFGGKTPFTAEIWFTNRTVKRDLKWGTPTPIQLIDPNLGFPVSLRAFGRWGIRIDDSRSFVSQLVGSMKAADSDKVHRFFIGEITQKLNAVLANAVTNGKLSVFAISSAVNDLSTSVEAAVRGELLRFGVEIVSFNIEGINIPEAEMSKIQDVLGKRMEAEQLSAATVGKNFATLKTFDILEAAAQNPSAGGGIIGNTLGIGIGVGAALPIGQQMGKMMTSSNEGSSPVPDYYQKLQQLKKMFEDGLIPEELYKKKQLEIIEGL